LTKLFRGCQWIPASAVAEQHTNIYRDGQCNLRHWQIGIADAESFGKAYERSDDSTAAATA
jgi:hypothetical protein